MATTSCGTCAKIVLFITNLIFWITGIILLGVGIWVTIDKTSLEFLTLFHHPSLKVLAYMLIGIGGFVTILGFLGCFGACHEQKWMIITYFVVVLLLLLAEIVCVILVFAFQSEVEKFVGDQLDDSIQKEYGTEGDEGVTTSVDALQISLECCGKHNYTDWETSNWSKTNMSLSMPFPISCCKTKEGALEKLINNEAVEPVDREKCYSSQPNEFMYSEGCYDSLYEIFLENLWVIGGIGIGIAVLQLFVLVLALSLVRNLKDDYE
ncbi:CD151 antigen-like isoform X2 [Anneissia japonica]|uniref:CD151 antigen-like isoform X2 n=1 Tax=Anneissia japonica TaxID=1529436 RepID=UPI00142597BA|nr:CD151 antigen-like isoform X2 [Anneissia japonica]